MDSALLAIVALAAAGPLVAQSPAADTAKARPDTAKAAPMASRTAACAG